MSASCDQRRCPRAQQKWHASQMKRHTKTERQKIRLFCALCGFLCDSLVVQLSLSLCRLLCAVLHILYVRKNTIHAIYALRRSHTHTQRRNQHCVVVAFRFFLSLDRHVHAVASSYTAIETGNTTYTSSCRVAHRRGRSDGGGYKRANAFIYTDKCGEKDVPYSTQRPLYTSY